MLSYARGDSHTDLVARSAEAAGAHTPAHHRPDLHIYLIASRCARRTIDVVLTTSEIIGSSSSHATLPEAAAVLPVMRPCCCIVAQGSSSLCARLYRFTDSANSTKEDSGCAV